MRAVLLMTALSDAMVAVSGNPVYPIRATTSTIATNLGSGLAYPSGIDMDSRGNLFISAYDTESLYKIDTSGVVSLFAGSGVSGGSGSADGVGTFARFSIIENRFSR